jgi:hypothetical protein
VFLLALGEEARRRGLNKIVLTQFVKIYSMCESGVEIITKHPIINLTVGHTYQ